MKKRKAILIMRDSQLDLFGHERLEFEGETKCCSRCKQHLPNNFDFFGRNRRIGSDGNVKTLTNHICKDCSNHQARILASLRKTAPPTPENCECCSTPFSSIKSLDIHLDHCHEKETFRGWLCKSCNIGIGMLGDDIDGLKKALKYLERCEEENG